MAPAAPSISSTPACGTSITTVKPDQPHKGRAVWEVDIVSNYANFGPTAPLEARIVFPPDYTLSYQLQTDGDVYDWHGEWIQIPQYGLSPNITHAGDTIYLSYIPGVAYHFRVEARQRDENGAVSSVVACGMDIGGTAVATGLGLQPVKFRAMQTPTNES